MPTRSTTTPDPLSLRTSYLRLLYENTELATATGFFYEVDDQTYLITSWHCLTGRHAETHETISRHGGIPNQVQMTILENVEAESDGPAMYRAKPLKTFLTDEDDRPLWYEHPDHGSQIDVAALRLDIPEGHTVLSINSIDYAQIDAQVSHDVFIIGYPLGLVGHGHLPIWKRASIATEPHINLDELPKMLVDTATRTGMSGSPVFLKYRGFYMSDRASGRISGDDWFGEGTMFLGVYSGRLGADEFRAQLGIVWRQEVIDDIIAGETRPAA